MATMGISAAMTRDITMLMGDSTTRPQLKKFISTLKRQKRQSDKNAKLKAELKADLRAAFKELKDEREGKVQLRDARELICEL